MCADTYKRCAWSYEIFVVCCIEWAYNKRMDRVLLHTKMNYQQTTKSGVGLSETAMCSRNWILCEQKRYTIEIWRWHFSNGDASCNIFFQQTQNKRIFDDAILLSNIHMLSAFIYVFPRVVFTDSDLTIKTFAGLR